MALSETDFLNKSFMSNGRAPCPTCRCQVSSSQCQSQASPGFLGLIFFFSWMNYIVNSAFGTKPYGSLERNQRLRVIELNLHCYILYIKTKLSSPMLLFFPLDVIHNKICLKHYTIYQGRLGGDCSKIVMRSHV